MSSACLGGQSPPTHTKSQYGHGTQHSVYRCMNDEQWGWSRWGQYVCVRLCSTRVYEPGACHAERLAYNNGQCICPSSPCPKQYATKCSTCPTSQTPMHAPCALRVRCVHACIRTTLQPASLKAHARGCYTIVLCSSMHISMQHGTHPQSQRSQRGFEVW